MRTHRFIGNFDFAKPLLEIRDPRTIRQFTKVLRLKPGSTVTLSDGHGAEYSAEIKKMDARAIYLLVRSERAREEQEKHAPVILAAAILKREHFEMIIEKTTEIGVSTIVPLITDRTIKKNIQKERALAIAREAAEQSGRRVLPMLRDPIDFDSFAEEVSTRDTVIFCDPKGDAHTPNILGRSLPLYVCIGPEGGWTDRERAGARKRGWHIVRLGETILRAETAAIIATFLALRSQEN